MELNRVPRNSASSAERNWRPLSDTSSSGTPSRAKIVRKNAITVPAVASAQNATSGHRLYRSTRTIPKRSCGGPESGPIRSTISFRHGPAVVQQYKYNTVDIRKKSMKVNKCNNGAVKTKHGRYNASNLIT